MCTNGTLIFMNYFIDQFRQVALLYSDLNYTDFIVYLEVFCLGYLL